MPIRAIVTKGTQSDYMQAQSLTKGIKADYLLADRGYDSDRIIAEAGAQGMKAVIPLRRNRTKKRDCDKYLYKRSFLDTYSE